MIYGLLRTVGFRLDPETAHTAALRAVRLVRPFASLRRRVEDPITVFGVRFPNRIGLAAGYDKDGTAWRALAALGFGHIEVGTVTPRPQAGNPRPRLHRLPEAKALINRMGFPSAGAEAVAARLGGDRPRGVVLGVSIGPNADTPPDRRIADYVALTERFAPLADYLAVNVSSPNTAGLRDLQGEPLADLLAAVRERAGTSPVLVKLSPDLDDLDPVVAAIEGAGIDGIVVGNTTLSRPGLRGVLPEGGLSGAPLGPLALRRLAMVTAATRLPVIAAGGIMDATDAAERFTAGATLLQVYTGLVYRGPRLIREAASAGRGGG